MRILYHHRTRATDAQGVHITEMINAFRLLGHQVEIASLVAAPSKEAAKPSRTDKPAWQRLLQKLPGAFEFLQLGYNLVGLWIISRQIRRFRPHFIYERYSLFNFSGVLASRWFRIPLLLEVNSPLALETRQEGLLTFHRLAEWSERVICNSSTAVITVTGVLRDILVELGVEADRITVVPNGVSPDRFAPAAADPALRCSLGLDQRRVIGFVGWFRPWHGLELLIQAFHQSGLHARDVSLLLVGDGPAMPALVETVDRLGLESAVVFTGAIPHRLIPSHVALFDCAVQPAANPYCCPMKIIEYLALAKPVIAPGQANIRELVEDGVDAIMFESGEAASLAASLRRLFDSPDLLQCIQAGADSAIDRRRYLWSRNAQRSIQLIFPATP
jgi:glycosyltransferase involved in cell wall biosynthesis